MSSSSKSRKPNRLREPSGAVSAALRYAGRRVRSERELAEHLRRRGDAPAAIRQAISACRGAGVVDDRVAARLWAETWAREGYSAAAVRSRLEAKGFEESTAGQIVQHLALASGDQARAAALLATRRRAGRRTDERVRAARRLAVRGYEPELIAEILDDAFGPSSE